MLSCVLVGNDSRDISRDGLRKRARGSDELTTKRGIYQLTPKDQDLRSLPMVTCVVPRAAAIARWLYPASRAPCTRKRSRLLPAVSRPLQTHCLLYTSRAHETRHDLVCRLLLEKKKK